MWVGSERQQTGWGTEGGEVELNGELSVLIKAKEEGERWIISLFSPAAGAPFLCQPAFHEEWTLGGETNYPGAQSRV